jgi:hypothetical protein
MLSLDGSMKISDDSTLVMCIDDEVRVLEHEP